MGNLWKSITAAACVIGLYLMKVTIVEDIFSPICRLYLNDSDFDNLQLIGGIILGIIALVIVLGAILLMERIANPYARFFLYVIMVSPIAFEIPDIFVDKSCLKAWQFPLEKWWHFAICLPIWILIVNRIPKYRNWFSKFDYALMAVVFIIYHLIKKY